MLLARNINLGAFGPRKVGGYEYMWCKRIELRVFWYDADLIHCYYKPTVNRIVTLHTWCHFTGQRLLVLAPVVQRLDNAIHRINRYPVDKC